MYISRYLYRLAHVPPIHAHVPPISPPPHTHAHTNRYRYPNICVYIYISMYNRYVHQCIHTNTYAHTHIPTYTHTHIQTYTKKHLHTKTNTNSHKRVHVCVHMCVDVLMCGQYTRKQCWFQSVSGSHAHTARNLCIDRQALRNILLWLNFCRKHSDTQRN